MSVWAWAPALLTTTVITTITMVPLTMAIGPPTAISISRSMAVMGTGAMTPGISVGRQAKVITNSMANGVRVMPATTAATMETGEIMTEIMTETTTETMMVTGIISK